MPAILVLQQLVSLLLLASIALAKLHDNTEPFVAVEDEIFGTDASHDLVSLECGFHLELLWQRRLDAGVYATPVLHTSLNEEAVRIVISSISDHIQILDGNGYISPQWPVHLEQEAVYASPLLYDVDADGEKDVIVVTYSGQILVLKPSTATQLFGSRSHPPHVPKLRVSTHWFEGHIDQSMASAFRKQAPVNNGPEDFDDPLCKVDFINSLTPEGLQSLSLFSAARSSRAKMHLFGEDADDRFAHEYPEEEGFVWVDAHVQSTPAVVDIDGDGEAELVISTSYYFDRDEYATVKASPISSELVHNFIGFGVVVMDMKNWSVRWSEDLITGTDLDLSTNRIFAAPTIVDIDMDGKLDIIVATPLGYVFALNMSGSTLEGFPLKTGPVVSQVAVEDIDGDGRLEMVFCDTTGTVFSYKSNGDLHWKAQTSGYASSNVVFADVDENGWIDVVVTTTSGNIYAFDGKSGDLLPHFPVHTGGRILASPLVVDLLREESDRRGLHIVAPSFDGNLYIVNGHSGCTSKVDIAEHVYSSVLAADVVGNGYMSLLVTTMSGHVLCFGTEASAMPLKTWQSQVQGLNGFTYRHDYHGIYVLESMRSLLDVRGSSFSLAFNIVDNRQNISQAAPQYFVEVQYQGQIANSKRFLSPGRKQIVVPCPREPWQGPVYVRMRNDHGQVFEDVFIQSFNQRFYQLPKWLLSIPPLAMMLATVAIANLQPPRSDTLLSHTRPHSF